MATNFKLLHNGMGFPRYSVVPPEFFRPNQIPRHLELGSIAETSEAVTVDFVAAADVSTMDDDELAKENAKLKEALGDAPQMVAKLKARVAELEAENDRLQVANAKGSADLNAAQAIIAEQELALREINDRKPPAPPAN